MFGLKIITLNFIVLLVLFQADANMGFAQQRQSPQKSMTQENCFAKINWTQEKKSALPPWNESDSYPKQTESKPLQKSAFQKPSHPGYPLWMKQLNTASIFMPTTPTWLAVPNF